MAYSSLIGAKVRRKEDPRLITGRSTYVGDLRLPGMCYISFVRSPYAHAKIRHIDTTEAINVPGVVAVFTGEDLINDYEPMPMSSSGEGEAPDSSQETSHTHYAISIGKVRYVGEIIAAVVAETQEAATDAASKVQVDWEELPAVADIEAALSPDAPRLYDNTNSNVEHVWRYSNGDVNGAFKSAHKIIKQRMINQRLAGIPMEGRAVVASPDPMVGGVTVWSSTQAPHLSRGDIAKVLRLPENAVRVIAPEVGGGFGVKIGIYPEDVALAAIARRLNIPVKWVETRSENLMATTHGRAQITTLEAAVDKDGKVQALKMHILADVGAYPVAPGIAELTGRMSTGVYDIPAVEIEATCVYTNTTPVAAYRGAGRPEAAYYIERMMDIIADELGLDPAEVRRRNFIPPHAFPYRTATGELYDSGEYDKALTKALELAGYDSLREEQRRLRDQNSNILIGIGISCYVEMCGFGPYDSAIVRVDPSGNVTVFTGISPHGQGQETTFAQIVADTLGVDYEKIIVRHGDTRETPQGMGTMGSRGLVVGGSALVKAVDKIRQKATKIAAHILEAAPEDIEVLNGKYQVRGVPSRSVTFAEIADRAYSDDLPEGMEPGLESVDFFKPPELVYPFGAHVAVVEIDKDTGVIHLRDYVSVDDCGRRISPMLVEGQVHGGLAQGISQALYEAVVYDSQGQLLTGTLMDYNVPRATQLPSFRTDKTETPTPHNPLQAKGIGEAATIGSTPAVANAVVDALEPFSIRHIDMPFWPEKIWRIINSSSH